MNKAVFIDKDGTLIEDIPYNVNPDLMQLNGGALEGLKALKSKGYLLILVSNQSGVARGYFKEDALRNVESTLQQMLEPAAIAFDGYYFCPHHPDGKVTAYSRNCDCRKPEPGLLFRAAAQHDINLHASWMVGDILNDVEAGNRAGCRTILIDNGNETEWLVSPNRKPTTTAGNLAEAAEIIIHQFEFA